MHNIARSDLRLPWQVDVNGPTAHPVFSHLKEVIGGGDIVSNYEKALAMDEKALI